MGRPIRDAVWILPEDDLGPGGNAGGCWFVWSVMYSTANYPTDASRWPAFRNDLRRFFSRLRRR
jgi:hypothetical protein